MENEAFTKILLVCATHAEALPLLSMEQNWAKKEEGLFSGKGSMKGIGLMITGIGMVNTAWKMGRKIDLINPQVAINFGVAGAFDPNLEIGQTVEIVSDTFSEMGADSPEGFLDLRQIGLENFSNSGKIYYNTLLNPAPSFSHLHKVSGITVNTISGEPIGIIKRKQIWNPQVETMEGAAFFQCCLSAGIPFFAFRGISNRVEPRNRDNWKMVEAIQNVNAFVSEFAIKMNS